MLAYLQPQQQREKPTRDSKEKSNKMAHSASVALEQAGTEPLSMQNLKEAIKLAVQEIESTFSKKLELLLSLVKMQLNKIQMSLSKTAQIADTELEMGVTLQEDSTAHQDKIQEKYLILAIPQ